MSGSAATITELRRLRHAHRLLIAARRALKDAGVAVLDEMDVSIEEVAARVVAIPVPCVLCRRACVVTIRVDDGLGAEPSGVLCGVCNARADASVLGAPSVSSTPGEQA